MRVNLKFLKRSQRFLSDLECFAARYLGSFFLQHTSESIQCSRHGYVSDGKPCLHVLRQQRTRTAPAHAVVRKTASHNMWGRAAKWGCVPRSEDAFTQPICIPCVADCLKKPCIEVASSGPPLPRTCMKQASSPGGHVDLRRLS